MNVLLSKKNHRQKDGRLFKQDYYWRKGIYKEYYKEECGLCGISLKNKMALIMTDEEYGECSDPVFCSLNCYKLFIYLINKDEFDKCYLCGENSDLFHHIDYENNEGIKVCNRCHSKIHNGWLLYNSFKPINERKYTNRWNRNYLEDRKTL